VRVACTLAGIVVLGIAFDRLFAVPIWMNGLWQTFGFVPLVLGLSLEASATYALWEHGRGTPNPDAHPKKLVTHGPYSWSRHPLYLARHLILVGCAWLLGSPSIVLLTLALFLLVHFVMIPREESRLATRFAQPYEAYQERVAKWVTLPRRGRTR